MADQWIKCIARGGNMVATAIAGRDLVESARTRHHIGRAETKALGETLLGALLLGSTCKPGERVSLSLKGDKFLRQAIADASPDGSVRGFIVAHDYPGDIDIDMGPWQGGLLSVARLKANEKDRTSGPYRLSQATLQKILRTT